MQSKRHADGEDVARSPGAAYCEIATRCGGRGDGGAVNGDAVGTCPGGDAKVEGDGCISIGGSDGDGRCSGTGKGRVLFEGEVVGGPDKCRGDEQIDV